ncbi:MAG: hypothetical protein HQL96_10135 [Magnetococcales bacterium]|nr:hypothetical protein [Magnetococcales bacterium]
MNPLPWLLILLAPTPANALDARNTSAPTATLEKIRLVEHPPCGANQLRVEAFFRVKGVDPADLLIVQTDPLREVTRTPVLGMDPEGRIVHGYCAPRGERKLVETRFLTVQGESTPVISHPVSTTPDQPVEKSTTPLLGIHRTTGYMQFADKQQPETKGTCCWHHVYVKHGWQGATAISEITIPMQFTPLPKPEGHHLYFMLYSAINEIKFYLGLQTNLKLRGKDHGVGAIFSRWDSQDPKDLHTVPGGFHEIGDYEGQFVSIRKPVNLMPGPMALRLSARPDPASGSHVWLDFTLIQQTDSAKIAEPIGSLRFPGPTLRLSKKLKIAVESYSLRSVSRANSWLVPFFDWSIAAPLINGKPVTTKPAVEFPELAPRILRVMQRPDNGVRIRRSGLINADDPADLFGPPVP